MQTKIYEDRYTLETYVNLMKRDWLLEDYMLTEEQHDSLGTLQYRICYEYIGTDGSCSSGIPQS